MLAARSRSVVLYNRLVRLRNRVENAWAQVDVQLKRRYDLIPNLVETVKGYAAHERETFEAVTAARTRAAAGAGAGGAGRGRRHPRPGARPALRRRRGVSRAAGERELPAAPGGARADREQDRGLAPGLQRHRAHLRQRAPDGAERAHRRAVRLHDARTSSRSRTRPARRHASRSSARRLGGSGARARRGRRTRSRTPCRPRTSPSRSQPDGTPLVDEQIMFAVRRRLQRRLPRHPAPRGRVARPGRRVGGRAAVPAGRLRRARLLEPAGDVRRRRAPTRACGSSGTTSAANEARRFRDPLPAPRPRRRLRRRRRRQPEGLGRRMGGRRSTS